MARCARCCTPRVSSSTRASTRSTGRGRSWSARSTRSTCAALHREPVAAGQVARRAGELVGGDAAGGDALALATHARSGGLELVGRARQVARDEARVDAFDRVRGHAVDEPLLVAQLVEQAT